MFEKTGMMFAFRSRKQEIRTTNASRDDQERTLARLVEDVANAKRFIESSKNGASSTTPEFTNSWYESNSGMYSFGVFIILCVTENQLELSSEVRDSGSKFRQ
mmetsp:Transcript_24106/g.66823  ORF Transcript_24106/g.66823 Transcript_24106/m.66823 type:complete len:103 (-) Transcript_24106:250-558(-)